MECKVSVEEFNMNSHSFAYLLKLYEQIQTKGIVFKNEYKDLIIKSLSNNKADIILPQFENLKISQS